MLLLEKILSSEIDFINFPETFLRPTESQARHSPPCDVQRMWCVRKCYSYQLPGFSLISRVARTHCRTCKLAYMTHTALLHWRLSNLSRDGDLLLHETSLLTWLRRPPEVLSNTLFINISIHILCGNMHILYLRTNLIWKMYPCWPHDFAWLWSTFTVLEGGNPFAPSQTSGSWKFCDNFRWRCWSKQNSYVSLGGHSWLSLTGNTQRIL